MKKHDLIITLLGAIFGVVMVTVFSIVLAESTDQARPPKDEVLLDRIPPTGGSVRPGTDMHPDPEPPRTGSQAIQPAAEVSTEVLPALGEAPAPPEEAGDLIDDVVEGIDKVRPKPNNGKPEQQSPSDKPDQIVGLDRARLGEVAADAIPNDATTPQGGSVNQFGRHP